MKKTLTSFCAGVLMSAMCAGFVACNEPEQDEWDYDYPYYYTDRGKQYLDVRKDRVIIKATSDAEADKLSELDIFISDDYPVDAPGVWVIAPIDPAKTSLDDILKLPGVLDVAYGFGTDDTEMRYLTELIFVKFTGTTPEKAFEKIGVSKNVVSIELFEPLSGIYRITLDVKLIDIVRICCKLYESRYCEWAEPSLIEVTKII